MGIDINANSGSSPYEVGRTNENEHTTTTKSKI